MKPSATQQTPASSGARPLADRRRRRRAALGLLLVVVVGGAVVACTSSEQNGSNVASSAAGAASGAMSASAAGGAASSAAAGASTEASSAASAAAGTGAAASGAPAASSAGASGGSGSAGKTASAPPIALDGRQIIRTGSFALAVTVHRTANTTADQNGLQDKVSDLANKVRAVATGVGGYISASDGQGNSQSITMRVPVSKYDAAHQQLGELGRLSGSESTQDVTGQLADLAGRLETMKDGVTRVRQLLAKATKISDVIAIESELSQREEALESTMRQRAAMADQVALSTITVVITGTLVGTAPKRPTNAKAKWVPLQLTAPGPSGFAGGVLAAYGFLKDLGKGIATFLGGVLPFLPILIVIVLLLPWLRRRFADARQIVILTAVPAQLGHPATGPAGRSGATATRRPSDYRDSADR